MPDDLHQLAYAAQLPVARPVRRELPPSYVLLNLGSSIMLIVAVAILAAGVLFVYVGLMDAGGNVPLWPIAAVGGSCLAAAAVLGILGGIGKAVRDIARNSYRW